MRKIKQIATGGDGDVVALCDDSTMWGRWGKDGWTEIPNTIPGGEPLENCRWVFDVDCWKSDCNAYWKGWGGLQADRQEWFHCPKCGKNITTI